MILFVNSDNFSFNSIFSDFNVSISSKKVADAQISYVGTGDMNDSVTKGWLSRYFAYVSPF